MSRRTLPVLIVLLVGANLVVGCGDDGGGGGGDDDGTIDADTTQDPDADPTMNPIDADLSTCDPAAPQCSNGCDDDNDGTIDGDDVECTGALDDDESSFATGINGDNMDVVNQDCFFDGNSGGGDDRCNQHVCCMLGLTSQECMQRGYDNNFDPSVDGDCPPVSADCVENCAPYTPPGCDCFGCCTICDDTGCYDVVTNPLTAPECDAAVISDPTKCPRCEKVEECGVECEPDGCLVCPGDELPPECEQQECPAGSQVCDDATPCPAGGFCSNGCCIAVID